MTSSAKASTSNSAQSGKKRRGVKVKPSRKLKLAAEAEELDALDDQVSNFVPPSNGALELFSQLPLSGRTQKGLKSADFTHLTPIQRDSLPLSLKGRDVLGAARTGSGKTLAFLIPVLEKLFRARWGPLDGLGALIISPTRELAVQIFQVLRDIGSCHTFSAGLVIGGKPLKDEMERLSKMNILVATPGRLLQHMDQTYGFAAENLEILVLDEADRILDLGFSTVLKNIVSNLPKSRQTLLFSATQSANVSNLAMLSLSSPEYVSVQETSADGIKQSATPLKLEQFYTIVKIEDKLDALYGFIRTHLKCKILVFASSGKQVKHMFTCFSKLRPGLPLLHLHGKMKQATRMATYSKFTSTSHCVMFATDIAARGLDFPAVDWVMQVDAPEDVDTYIHRVGRTARYESKGSSIMFLAPSEEEGMLKLFEAKKITAEKIKIKDSKNGDTRSHLQNYAFQDADIKYLAQRAFISYVKSLHLQGNKDVFKFNEYDLNAYAGSLGLAGTPTINFGPEPKVKAKNLSTSKSVYKEEDAINSDDLLPESSKRAKDKKKIDKSKIEKMFERKNQGVLSEHFTKLINQETAFGNDVKIAEKDEEDDDFITLKREDHKLESDQDDNLNLEELKSENQSRRKERLAKSKKLGLKMKGSGTKLVFDDEALAHPLYEMQEATEEDKSAAAGQRRLAEERERLRIIDAEDKAVAREKRRELKRKRKGKDKSDAVITEPTAGLDSADEDDGYVSPDFDSILDEMDRDEKRAKTEQDMEAEALRLLNM